jgi:DNA-binding MarR family transcriptional regulator
MDSTMPKRRRKSTLKSVARTPGGELVTDFVLKLLTLYGAIYTHGVKLTRPEKQTPPRWQVMGAIENEPLTMSQIGRRMGMTRQGVRRVTMLLSEAKLITFEDNPDHARAPRIALTQEGMETLSRIHSFQAKWANEIAKHISRADLAKASKTLEDLTAALKRVEKVVFVKDKG